MTTAPRLLRLRSDLANCRQKGSPVESYFGRLTKLWDDLVTLRPLKVCRCGLCNCNLSADWEKQRQEDRLYEFLLGLDDKYGIVRSNLLSRQPLPSVEKAYMVVTQDEASKDSVSVDISDAAAFSVNFASKPRVSTPVKDKSVILGFPEWWGDRPRNRTGHGRGSQPSARGRGAVRVNSVQATTPSLLGPSPSVSSDNQPPSGLSDDQWKTLVSLLNAGKIGANANSSGMSSFDSWILDTGALHHLTGRLELLQDPMSVTPCSIVLPDGRHAFATRSGSVSLSSHLHLSDVFYVEGLHVNLLSVSQLLGDGDYIVQFTNVMCSIQDRATKTLIGVGDLRDGLYYFKGVETAAPVQASDTCSPDLWHRRLGHPSSSQNGRAERKHRHILNIARALMFQANFPIEFWGDCILTAGFLINRTPTKLLSGRTPFEIIYARPPDYHHLRSVGCLCYAHNKDHKGDKFASRSIRSVFVGYPSGKRGWRLYDLEQRRFFVSRDVRFCEDQFPFRDNPVVPCSIPLGLSSSEVWPVLVDDDQVMVSACPSSSVSAPLDSVSPTSPIDCSHPSPVLNLDDRGLFGTNS
ncbi:PREDICTED: uncharacterized protein LOC104807073 [Tarenaya hassleriana]|uniref:uncharacterized protein LOC104807073 n=1 Tax=Tarenaya hassleriana TaxID=28532 RepID=UPI00053C546F|nr:PREDICTED: uncharacterized protein LOC104807073 [Tarenaya hassleriana]